jgi:hypothetical protein
MQFDVEKSALPLAESVCIECGAHVPDTFNSCDAFAASLMINPTLKVAARPNRLVIDSFALQHPKRACKSAKSYAGHLAGLCCGIEYAGSEKIHHAVQQWFSTSAEHRGLIRPTEPEHRGLLTVQHTSVATDSETFDSLVREWANCVWAAYAAQHDIARAWVESALNKR